MNKEQWNAFCTFKTEFKQKCCEWQKNFEQLKSLQAEAAKKDTPDYPVENPVVYNTSLDEITEKDEIKLIVIGDNPGKNEQLNKNKKYLVGQAGKIADGFFKKNPSLGVDFRKNVIILNKTPVHTAKTGHLKYLIKNGGNQIEQLILESQIWMAERTAWLHQSFISASGNVDGNSRTMEVWLVGYSELKKGGLFLPYKEAFLQSYTGNNEAWNKVKVFQHFSMNRFSIDLNEFIAKNKTNSLIQAIDKLGEQHKKEIFIS